MGESESLAQTCKGKKKKKRNQGQNCVGWPTIRVCPGLRGISWDKLVTLEQGAPVGSPVKPRAEGLGQTQKEKEWVQSCRGMEFSKRRRKRRPHLGAGTSSSAQMADTRGTSHLPRPGHGFPSPHRCNVLPPCRCQRDTRWLYLHLISWLLPSQLLGCICK